MEKQTVIKPFVTRKNILCINGDVVYSKILNRETGASITVEIYSIETRGHLGNITVAEAKEFLK
jgi:hypothetical protein